MKTVDQDRHIAAAKAARIERNKKRSDIVLEGMATFVKGKLKELGADACIDDEDVWTRIARTGDVLRKIGWPEVYIVEEIAEQLPARIYLRNDLQGWFELATRREERTWTEEELAQADFAFWRHAKIMARLWAERNAKNG